MSLVVTGGSGDVGVTVDRLVSALEKREVQVFARIDHAGAARAAGLELGDEEVLVFGNPRAGTLLMQADATIGYELPLRILVWDDGGTTKLAYRPPAELLDAYAVDARRDVVEAMGGLLDQLVREAAAG